MREYTEDLNKFRWENYVGTIRYEEGKKGEVSQENYFSLASCGPEEISFIGDKTFLGVSGIDTGCGFYRTFWGDKTSVEVNDAGEVTFKTMFSRELKEYLDATVRVLKIE